MRLRWNIFLFMCAVLLAVTDFCSADGKSNATPVIATNSPAIRSMNWAQPFAVNGVKNCYQVSSNLFRGAQPTAAGMKNLKAAGIKTIVNLREFHSDTGESKGMGLKMTRIASNPWHGETEDVIGFLKIMADTNNLPVFIHCQRGADRTGMMCAMYRITVCDWTKDEAIAELKDGGFGFYSGWKNLVKLIEKADVEDLKRQAGLLPK